MRTFLTMIRELPFAMKVLLASTTARSLSFFAILAYLPIFLYDTVGLDGAATGYVIGGSVLVGIVTSVYGGYLADRITKINFIILLDVAIMVLYLSLTILRDPYAVTAVLLLASIASSTMGVTGSALLAELVPPENRTKVFSLRYSLQNIGAVVGPFLGVVAVAAGSGGPFAFSVVVIGAALLPLVVFRRRFFAANETVLADDAGPAAEARPVPAADEPEDEESPKFREVLRTMRADRRLAYFTIGGTLSIVVYGPLLSIMSQYLVVVESRETAYRLVASVSAANAVVVVTTQYVLGARLTPNTLMRWLTAGTAAFAVGLYVMSLSTNAIVLVLAVAVFTLGEVIVVPAEFTFIDSIAPGNLRGSYFGAQNLVHIGIAVGPILCGFFLQHFAPAIMFYVLIAIVLAGWAFYAVGCRAQLGSTGEKAESPV